MARARSWLGRFALLGVLVFVLAACAVPPSTTTPAVDSGSQPTAPASEETSAEPMDLTVGDVFFYNLGFDPPLVASFFEYRVASQLYDRLTAWDGQALAGGGAAEPMPSVAESWTLSDDGLEYTFKIRAGIEFSSGRPLTAAAVKASFERTIAVLETAGTISRFGWLTSVSSMEAPDDSTFVLTLAEPYAPLLAALASVNFGIVDVEEAMANEVDGDNGAAWMAQHSAGSGPFVFEEFTPEQRLVLRRNPTYWGGFDNVQPAFERVIFAHIPENATRELMIGSGELDIALGLDPTSLTVLATNSNVRVEQFPTLQTCNFLVDLRAEQIATNYPKVLQALRYSIDYEGFRNIVAGGLAQVRLTNFLPGMAGYDAAQDSAYTYDPEKAKALLAEAGYADGFEVTIQSRPGGCGSVSYARASEFWQQNLAEIGITAQIIETTGANFWAAIIEGSFRDYGLSVAGATFLDADQPATVRAVQESQLLGWKEINPEAATRAEELTTQGRAESDPAARQAIYAEIAQLMLDSSPYITFLQVQDAVTVESSLSGLVSVPGFFPIELRYVNK